MAIKRLLAALQWPSDLEKYARAFYPPKHKPRHVLNFPPYLICFKPLWCKDSLILVLSVMRNRPNNDPNYRKLTFMEPRPHKSYTRVVYICASHSTPSNIFNLIFKARLTWFKGWFNSNNQSLQRKNARARS